MAGGGSDAESSGSEARPLFRPLKSAPAAGIGRSAKIHRDVDTVLDASALPDVASSDDDARPRVRVASAGPDAHLPTSCNVDEDDNGKGGALAKLNKRLRKKKELDGGEDKRAKRAKKRLERMGLTEDISDNPSMEDTMKYLEQLEYEEDGDEDVPKRNKRAKGTLLKRKPATKGGQMQVRMDGSAKKSPANKASPGSGSKASTDEITPPHEARLRIKENKKGNGKAKQKEEGDGLGSESEEGEDNDQIAAWEGDLTSRIDKEHPGATATAFSIKPCPISAIRQLPVTSFLGRRRLEEGGQLLIDTDGYINVHFMLGTYKNLQKLHERQKRGDKAAKPAEKADIRYLRWLVKKAIQLRVTNKRELRLGKVNQGRIKAAEKSFRWSLARKLNLAEFSDNEGADEVSPELQQLKFKAKETTEDIKAERKEGRQNLRTNIVKKQSEVSASSSHNIDMQEMQNRLTAPSLSFDWEEKGSDDDEGGLEVDMPEDETKNSKRNMFRDQLQRSASFHMAKGLTQRKKTTFNLQKSFSAEKLGSAPAPAEMERTQTAPARLESQRNVASSPAQSPSEKVVTVESTLWNELEQSDTTEKVVSEDASEKPIAAADPTQTPASSSKADQSAATDKSAQSDAASTPKKMKADPAPEKYRASDSSSEAKAQQEPNMLEKFLQQDLSADSSASTVKRQDDEGQASSVVTSTKEPSVPLSQDWHGITPTAMWSAEVNSRDSFESATEKASQEKHTDISPTMPFVPTKGQDEHLEISPTMPFVARVESDQALEISPTMPFVPTKAAEYRAEISPTAPFIANNENKENVVISPTQPFVATEATSGHTSFTKDLPQIAASLMPEAASLSSVQQSTGDTGANATEEKQAPARRLQRSTSLISEDSLSDSPSEEEGEGQEGNAKRRKREREWLRHKRRAARQEAKDATASVKRAKLEAQDLGVSLLSTQDRFRYQSVVDTVQVSAKTNNAGDAAPMLRGSDATDEADVFGGFGRAPSGIQKKKSFLMK